MEDYKKIPSLKDRLWKEQISLLERLNIRPRRPPVFPGDIDERIAWVDDASPNHQMQYTLGLFLLFIEHPEMIRAKPSQGVENVYDVDMEKAVPLMQTVIKDPTGGLGNALLQLPRLAKIFINNNGKQWHMETIKEELSILYVISKYVTREVLIAIIAYLEPTAANVILDQIYNIEGIRQKKKIIKPASVHEMFLLHLLMSMARFPANSMFREMSAELEQPHSEEAFQSFCAMITNSLCRKAYSRWVLPMRSGLLPLICLPSAFSPESITAANLEAGTLAGLFTPLRNTAVLVQRLTEKFNWLMIPVSKPLMLCHGGNNVLNRLYSIFKGPEDPVEAYEDLANAATMDIASSFDEDSLLENDDEVITDGGATHICSMFLLSTAASMYSRFPDIACKIPVLFFMALPGECLRNIEFPNQLFKDVPFMLQEKHLNPVAFILLTRQLIHGRDDDSLCSIEDLYHYPLSNSLNSVLLINDYYIEMMKHALRYYPPALWSERIWNAVFGTGEINLNDVVGEDIKQLQQMLTNGNPPVCSVVREAFKTAIMPFSSPLNELLITKFRTDLARMIDQLPETRTEIENTGRKNTCFLAELIREWMDVNEGSIEKQVAYFLDKPGDPRFIPGNESATPFNLALRMAVHHILNVIEELYKHEQQQWSAEQ